MAQLEDDLVGKLFGHYRLGRLLGKGSYGQVYLGEHVQLNISAAIKVLSDNNHEDFLREAQIMATLNHPHIVQVRDCGTVEGRSYFVMDYAGNGTLRQRFPRGTRVPLATIAPYVQQIAEALQYAHDIKPPIIHRDVKPDNMLLDKNDQIMLSDFGLARVAQSSSSRSMSMAGTPFYMAPEQVQGRRYPASDQYALAIVVYEWITGAVPFNGTAYEIAMQHLSSPPPSLCENAPDLSPEIEEVVMKALAKDPKQRYESVQAFADALERAIYAAPTEGHLGLENPPAVENHGASTDPAGDSSGNGSVYRDRGIPTLPSMFPDAQPDDPPAAFSPQIDVKPPSPVLPETPLPPTSIPSPETPLPVTPPQAQTRPDPKTSRRKILQWAIFTGAGAALVAIVGGELLHNKPSNPSPGGKPISTAVPKQPTPDPTAPPSGTATALAEDNFHRTDEQGWGTASDGQSWQGDARTNAAFSIQSSQGVIHTGSIVVDPAPLPTKPSLEGLIQMPPF